MTQQSGGAETGMDAVPMTDEQRRYYLDVMGIQSWALYAPAGSVTPEPTAAENRPEPVMDAQAMDTPGLAEAAPKPAVLLEEQVQNCRRCERSVSRRQGLPGRGNTRPRLMIISLAPDETDDACGQLLSGDAGELLGKMLKAIELDINEVFITSLLKCAAPDRHSVKPAEITACSLYLKEQLAQLQPQILFVMGERAAQSLLNSTDKIDTLRSQLHYYEQRPVLVSYAASDLLARPAEKKKAWADLQLLQKQLQSLQAQP